MPMTDRTFSDSDIIRIYLDHLTPTERQAVRNYFAGIVDGEGPGDGDIGDADEFGQLWFDIFLAKLTQIPGIGFLVELLAFWVSFINLGDVTREAVGGGGTPA